MLLAKLNKKRDFLHIGYKNLKTVNIFVIKQNHMVTPIVKGIFKT